MECLRAGVCWSFVCPNADNGKGQTQVFWLKANKDGVITGSVVTLLRVKGINSIKVVLSRRPHHNTRI